MRTDRNHLPRSRGEQQIGFQRGTHITVNSLYKNWSGQPQWTQDAFSAPVTDEGHTETSAVYFNNLWLLYHRHRGWQGDPNRTTIGVSTSLDGTNFTFVGNVGTPYIGWAGNHIYIGYHGFSGGTSPPYLQRGVARFDGSDPRQITAVDASYNNNLARSTSPVTFLRQNGGAEDRPVFSAGYGAADVIRYIAGSPGTDDGGFYIVLHGYQGSPFCNDPNTSMVIAMP